MKPGAFPVSRRALLAGMGLGGAAALLPYVCGERRARAAAAAIPTRVLFVYGMGSIRAFWPPLAAPGAAAPTETSFTMGPLHAPLTPHIPKLIFIDGMDMSSDLADPLAGANAHVSGGTHALTAHYRQTQTLSGGVSIDQYIAKTINSPAPVTKLPSLELSSGCTGGDAEGGPHYLAPGQVIAPERNPMNSYNRVFAGFTAPMDDAAAAKAAADALAQKKSALDFAAKAFAGISPSLSAADRAKLDAHASAIRDLEARLSLTAPVPTAACAAPDATYAATAKASPKDPAKMFDLDARLATAAFACDLARVATIHLPTHYDLEPAIGYTAGVFGTTDSHDLTHKTNNERAALWNNPDAMALVKKVHVFQAQFFASLLDQLKSIPEADGTTLLDHTAVLWCGQIAEGGHDVAQLPWIIAGSAGGYFKTGRYLKLARPNGKGPSHNGVFISLANAMGIKLDTFGEPSVSQGPLPGLTG